MEGKLLKQVMLKVCEEDVRSDISAIAHTPDGNIWLASDELTTVERLSPTSTHEFAHHRQFAVGDYVDLQDTQSEIDIEGMDFSEGYLWLVGSHSTKRKSAKGKDAERDIQRLLEITTDANRYLLARIPIADGELVKQDDATDRFAASLKQWQGQSELTKALQKDEHIGPFLQMKLPSKDNGFDIEALAVKGNRLFLGLRGPVLRGMAIILEIEIKAGTKARQSGEMRLKRLENKRLYRKHFVDLNGLGIRDLCFDGEDLIILAGATMQLSSTMQVFRFQQALLHSKDTLWLSSSGALQKLFDLPPARKNSVGSDNAEGMTILPCGLSDGGERVDQTSVMVVYDSPSKERLREGGILADVFAL